MNLCFKFNLSSNSTANSKESLATTFVKTLLSPKAYSSGGITPDFFFFFLKNSEIPKKSQRKIKPLI